MKYREILFKRALTSMLAECNNIIEVYKDK